MDSHVVLLVALFGLVVGSFLNVVIARLPEKEAADRSLNGRSRCPRCRNTIAAYDNIPVFSWLLLRGKCRNCNEPISARYPLVEVLTGVMWAAVAANTSQALDAAWGIVFMSLLIAITFIDIDHKIIPNVLSLPGILIGLAIGIVAHPQRWLELLISTFAAGFVLLVVALIKPGGMGMGDVKLVAMMGAFLGAPVAIAMFSGFLLGLLPSMYLLIRHGTKARKMAIPFGPFLAGGGVIGWFWGHQLLQAYLDTLKSG